MSYQYFLAFTFLLLSAFSLPGMHIARGMEVENTRLAALATTEHLRKKCLAVALRAYWWYGAFSFGTGVSLFMVVWALTSFSFIFLMLPIFLLIFEGAISCSLGTDFFAARNTVFLADWWHKSKDPERARTVFYFQWIVAAGVLFAYDIHFMDVETLLYI